MLANIDQFTFYRGRVALAALLRAAGVERGDDVALQAFTCVAVPEALLSIGARPVYVDTLPKSFTMDPNRLAEKLTSRTRAIVVQHTFGIPTDMAAVLAASAPRGIPVIEDCAHAIGSTVNGAEVGTLGAAAFFSFEASKPLFSGIGGSARVNDPAMAERLRAEYRNYREPPATVQARILAMYLAHRIVYRPATFWAVRSMYRGMIRLGAIPKAYNEVSANTAPAEDFARALGGMQRRLLRGELARLDAGIAHRRRIAAAYRERIRGADVMHPELARHLEAVFGRYPVLTERKAALVAAAPDRRVELASWYSTPVHPLEGEQLRGVGYEPGSCPNAEWLTRRVVSLPTGRSVGERDIERAAALFAA